MNKEKENMRRKLNETAEEKRDRLRENERRRSSKCRRYSIRIYSDRPEDDGIAEHIEAMGGAEWVKDLVRLSCAGRKRTRRNKGGTGNE